MHIPDFARRLDRILKERGLTQAGLAGKAGITPRHLSVTKNSGPDYTEKFVARICAALDMSIEDFLKQDEPNIAEYVQVPLREATGGMGGGSYVNSRRVLSYISLRKDFLLTKTSSIDSLSFVHASGESMFPTIPPDAAVLIDESQKEPVNNKIFFIMYNGELLIKRLEVKNNRVMAILSDNGNIRSPLEESDRLEIIGRALLQQTIL